MSDETVAPEFPAAGSDPDSKQRLAKTIAAAGAEVPEGLSVDPVTDKDRAAARIEHDELREAAEKRREAAAETNEGETVARTTPPTGRATKAEARQSVTEKKG